MTVGKNKRRTNTPASAMFWVACLLVLPLFQYEGMTTTTRAFSPMRQQQQQLFRQSRRSILFGTSKANNNKNKDTGDDWFQQKPGENDVAFIKRITSSTPPKAAKPKPIDATGYQRIEDWEVDQQEARKNGTLSWEEKVQFDGQRFGNQVRQNDILMRQINSGF
jgi:hypothetical protein